MKKTLKALVLMTFCICMIMSTMIMASAIGKVTGAKATSVTYNSATLTWKKTSGADGYEIQQYKSKKWTTIKKIESASTVSFKVSNLTTGTTYKYRVRAYDKKLFNKYDYSAYVNINVTPLPAKVTGLKASSAGYDSVKLSWSKVSGASGYVVQQYKSKKWVDIKTVTSNSYTVTGLTTDTSYSFRVRAYRTVSKKKHYSASYSSTVKCTPKLPAISTVKVSNETTTAVTLSWDKVSGATGYQVYNPKTKEWVSTKGKTKYTIKSLSANSKYTAKVRAFRKKSKTYYGGEKSIAFVTKPAALKNVQVSCIANNTLKVSWTKAANVDGYSVLLYNYSTKKETKTNTKSTSLILKDLNPDVKYKITVRAYVKNTEYIYSENSVPYTGYAPLVIKAGSGTDKTTVNVTWNSAPGATKYVLDRYDSATNEWSNIYSGKATAYSDEIGENNGALYRVTPYDGSTALAGTSAGTELATKGITLSKATNKITVSWTKPSSSNTINFYSVYEKPRKGSDKTAEELVYVIDTKDTKETMFTAYGTEQTYVIYAIYGITPVSMNRTKVAEFTVRAEDLEIDSSDTSKNGQILKLVDAINRTKYEQSKVSVTQDSTIAINVDSITMDSELYLLMKTFELIDSSVKIQGFKKNKETGRYECNGEENINKFMKGIMGSSNDNLNTVTTIKETVSFYEGKGLNSNQQYSYLKTYIEPSLEEPYTAYLYNGSSVSKWDEGFSSVTTKVLSNGNYSFEGTIKQEEFGKETSSKATNAKYHSGFTSSFDGLNLSATDGMDNIKTVVGKTKLTAEYTPDGKLVKYTIGKTTIDMDLEASMGDVETEDGKKVSDASIGMGMSGYCTISYSFKR